MKKLTSNDSLITINHYKNILASEGIKTVIKNEFLGGILGEVPYPEVWPELWVTNDLDYQRGLELIAETERSLDDFGDDIGPAWVCEHCGNDNEGQFGVCWSCGKAAT